MHHFLLRRRASLDPARFQGWGRRRAFFEGWYFKVVIPAEEFAFAFIPGISYDAEGRGHSFLQVLDGTRATTAYHTYTVHDFRPAADRFSVQVGPHHFATDRLCIDLPDLQLDLTLTDLHPWPARTLAPGVMGWYGFVPGMQCYHGLVSLHHRLTGTIRHDGRSVDLTTGVGYTEKDWGSGFPDAWIWGQSNHLSGTAAPASLMFSVASIPWLGSSFRGFLCTFLLEGELHTFTTWTKAREKVTLTEGARKVTLEFSDRRHHLTIVGHPAPGGNLASPIGGAMTGKINESLRAELEVSLLRDGREVYRGLAAWAGLEVSENAAATLCE
ncbi:tocopherol cyclase-like protein [Neolewinella xylanilytica]|uniref:Tocopherol cyclase-like protein n=1 Tax=Neolewinella xylanilytica TaxID=1514080 RepID=A0A2S6I9N8_9BACT|nr:tocopherol cyclase family protein [Neolewinella xylanilytica]PPK88214.1 tocopherol cyclase-like protein [Neolewinella xylanilytica]